MEVMKEMDMDMNAFIVDTDREGNDFFENMDLIGSLKENVEKCVTGGSRLIIDISHPIVGGCYNTICPEDYIVSQQELYLVAGNFELHICLSEIKDITYDDALNKSFRLEFDGIEIGFEFLETAE